MLSNKKLIVNKNFSKPGNKLHIADHDQFVTIKSVRASIDEEFHELQTGCDMFKINVTSVSDDNMSIWISLKSVKEDGILLKDFPLAGGDTLRVSASQNILEKFVVFGYFVESNA